MYLQVQIEKNQYQKLLFKIKKFDVENLHTFNEVLQAIKTYEEVQECSYALFDIKKKTFFFQ